MPKLKLEVTHTHAGVVYPAGRVIEVDEHTARWLIERGAGKPVDDAQTVQETAVGTAVLPEPRFKRKAKE